MSIIIAVSWSVIGTWNTKLQALSNHGWTSHRSTIVTVQLKNLTKDICIASFSSYKSVITLYKAYLFNSFLNEFSCYLSWLYIMNLPVDHLSAVQVHDSVKVIVFSLRIGLIQVGNDPYQYLLWSCCYKCSTLYWIVLVWVLICSSFVVTLNFFK